MKKQIIALALATYGMLAVEAAEQRAYAAGYFLLTLDGGGTGFIKSVEGGAVSSQVIEAPSVGGQAADKFLGPLRYESFDVRFGPSGIDGAMSEWISRSWNSDPGRRSGSFITTDNQFQAKSRKEFRDAILTATTFPACDAFGKDPGFIKVTLAPEFTRSVKGAGKPVGVIAVADQKRWLPRDFRLKIDGLDCTRIVRIESFTVKQTLRQVDVGEAREPMNEPGKIEFPNLKITFNAASAGTWQDWFQGFVIEGNNGVGGERRGSLEFLSPDGRQVLAAIEFTGLGIFRLAEAPDPNDAVTRYTADLYCEKMAFIPGKPGIFNQ